MTFYNVICCCYFMHLCAISFFLIMCSRPHQRRITFTTEPLYIYIRRYTYILYTVYKMLYNINTARKPWQWPSLCKQFSITLCVVYVYLHNSFEHDVAEKLSVSMLCHHSVSKRRNICIKVLNIASITYIIWEWKYYIIVAVCFLLLI